MIPMGAQVPPHTHQLMRLVLLATLPGLIALTWFFGFGTLTNLLWAVPAALGFEALALKLRGRPAAPALADCSALITAVFLAISLPPASPWWLILIGAASAILLAKQLYGGLGSNLFNPAMVGYAVLLVAFPLQMNNWAPPRGAGLATLGPLAALYQSLDLPAAGIDARTMATPLDLLRQNSALLMSDLAGRHPQFGAWGGLGWVWVNAAFLAGGLFLLQQRIISWHIPVALLSALAFMSLLFYDGGSSASGGSPLLHLFSGATLFAAFFIATDPVTSPSTPRGRLIFGAAIGVLIFLIRHWGRYPDGVAFAVLLLNFALPLIERYTQPRVYGHPRRSRWAP
jgi:electron transport complex protein RnfD